MQGNEMKIVSSYTGFPERTLFMEKSFKDASGLIKDAVLKEAIKNNLALPLELTGHDAEYRAFYEQITIEPDNWDQRAIFADWLEDIGAVMLCNGQRWQVEHGKWPSNEYGGRYWGWWSSAFSSDYDDIPETIANRLYLWSENHFTEKAKEYPHLHIAEIDLAMALSTQEESS